jgi:hypothetical protein
MSDLITRLREEVGSPAVGLMDARDDLKKANADREAMALEIRRLHAENQRLTALAEAAKPQPTTEDTITVSHAIATTTDIARLRAAAKLWWDAMHGQHEMLGHWLDGCRKCRKARREGEPSYACEKYKTWQKQYSDAVGAW